MSKLYIFGGGLLAFIALLALARWDGGRDAKRDLEADSNRARVTHIQEANEDARKIEDLSDDAFRRDLCRRLSMDQCPN